MVKKYLIFVLVFLVCFTQVGNGLGSHFRGNDSRGNDSRGADSRWNDSRWAENVAEAASVDTSKDLVVLVVDSDLDKNPSSYIGLKDKYGGLDENTIGGRITRYAEDIIDHNSHTDVKFLFFDKNTDTVSTLSQALEAIYPESNLAGAVFIGDIPLPVVNNNGNRYVSLFPYTDFVDKDADFPRPEIWHGVIPLASADTVGYEDLATFFDKNHLYYTNDPNFAKFEKKLFFADLIHEKEKLNADLFKYYLKYLEAWEDLAYKRYNKSRAKELSNEVSEELVDESGEFYINKENEDPEKQELAEKFAEHLKNNSVFDAVPDIYTKQIIDKILPKYVQLFTKYSAQLNNWAENTGRYEPEDVDSMPKLITMKDEYTKAYLKNVNDALEKRINKVVEKIQEPVPLLDQVTLTGKIDDPDLMFGSKTVKYNFNYNGIKPEVIETVKQCSMYLGSGKGLTWAVRSQNPGTGSPIHTAGVNTRLVSAEEAYKISKGKAGNGAVIGDVPEYGVSAFYGGESMSGVLKKGDLIVKVNGKALDYKYSFDQAASAAYQAWKADKDKDEISVEYYRGGSYFEKKFGVSGAIFELYDGGYDESAGCNYKVTVVDEHPDAPSNPEPDECIPWEAGIPVSDPAGAVRVDFDGDLDEMILNSCYGGWPEGKEGEDLVPSDIVLYDDGNDKFTLDYFADQFGGGAKSLEELARKLFVKNGVYTLPASLTKFDDAISLEVSAAAHKTVASLIIHNEPTAYTISAQLKSGGTPDMPIDSPRYVSFLNKNREISRVDYLNLFETPNYSQLEADVAALADKLAAIPGAYRVFGADAKTNEYSLLQIRDEIIDMLSPAIASELDDPINGFDLNAGSIEKIYDSLNWKKLNIDEKHAYVLNNYLNPGENAFVGDRTLLPAPAGFGVGYGYEAAYLVLDGEEEYFGIDFNKESVVEDDVNFGSGGGGDGEVGAGGDGAGGEEVAGEDGDDDGEGFDKPEDWEQIFQFVMLDRFMKELTEFMLYFTKEPKLTQKCDYDDYDDEWLSEDPGDFANEEPGDEEIDEEYGEIFPGPGESKFAEPASILIEPDSSVLVANGKSKTKVNISVLDKDGNVIEDTFEQLALFVDGPISLDPDADINEQILGTQIVLIGGKKSVDVYAGTKTGNAKLIVVLMDYELEELLLEFGDDAGGIDFSQYPGGSKTFQVLDDVDLKITPNKSFVSVGGEILKLKTELMHDGKVLTGYNGPISFDVANKSFGAFVGTPPQKMVNGVLHEANVQFQTFGLAGDAEIRIEVPGLVTGAFIVDVKAGKPDHIELSASGGVLATHAAASDEVVLSARILDKYENQVYHNNNTSVKFSATEATKDFVNFVGAKSALSLNGVASTTIKGGKMSGMANLVATSTGVEAGTLSLEVKKLIKNIEVYEDFVPRALYVSLLGSAFGDPLFLGNDGDDGSDGGGRNLAESFLFSGTTEAVSAVTANVDDARRLFYVDGYGGIETFPDSIDVEVLPYTESFPFHKVIFTDSLKKIELASAFIVPDNDAETVLLEGDANADGAGIFVKRISFIDPSIEFVQKKGGIYIMKNEKTLARIDNFGRIDLIDEKFELGVPVSPGMTGGDGMTFEIFDRGEVLASVVIRGSKGAEILSYKEKFSAFFPGLYVQMSTSNSDFELVPAYSGDSTAGPRGVYFVNNLEKLDITQTPGFSYTSLENAKDNFGLGFEGDNKHMLLFAAGNSVGESHRFYASEVGIVYGDPLIRLNKALDSSFTKDIGKPVFNSDKDILELKNFDYNADGLKDILLIYEDGLVRLLENIGRDYRDRGYILNVYEGIMSATNIDINNDGYDDLIVGTKESCHADDICLSVFVNDNGNFVRETVNIGISNDLKIYEIKAGDLNNDDCEDVVFSDSSANIHFLYNLKSDGKCGELEHDPGSTKNFGVQVDSGMNAIGTVFVNYEGMGASEESLIFALPSEGFGNDEYGLDAAAFEDAMVNSDAMSAYELPEYRSAKEFEFIPIVKDANFSGSTRKAVDVDAKTIVVGDKINYTIIIKNDGGAINNLMLSDVTPLTLKLDMESLKCLDAGCNDELKWLETGMSARSHVISNISVPANGQRTILYDMSVLSIPQVHFDLGNNFANYKKDDYLDVLVRPEVNPEGTLTYLYSNSVQNGLVSYKKLVAEPEGFDMDNAKNEAYKDAGLPGLDELLNYADKIDDVRIPFGQQIDYDDIDDIVPAVPDTLQSSMESVQSSQNEDKDYDGTIDSWDDFVNVVGGGYDDAMQQYENFARNVAGEVESVVNMLRCSGGGCLPIPYNYAFFAPDDATPGIATMAFGVPNPAGFAPFYPSQAPSGFRLYAMPTLTMGLTTAFCIGPGPGHASPCFVFAIPMQALGLCPDILGPINDAIAAAKNAMVNPDIGMSAVISDGNASSGSDAVNVGGMFSDPSSLVSASSSINIKIPGFPSVITNWFDKQTDEIFNKLLDLPDLYFIYPDARDLISDKAIKSVNYSDIKSIHDFLTAINSIPMIRIETKEVLVKIPAISETEIEKYKYQIDEWIRHHENELAKLEEFWSCDLNEERRTLCDLVTLQMIDLIKNVKKFMKIADQLQNLPRTLMNWRHAESRLAGQIVCYLDTIMEFTGGYITRQQKTIESWMKAAEDAVKTFRGWKAILDLITEYETSCDQCMNDRFSKLGLLLSLFFGMPDIPIIPIPKWPDIVFDISKLKTGVKIVWPEVNFQPEPVRLPNLPVFNLPELPEILPHISVNVPSFEIPELFLAFEGFQLPELPSLPALPVPELPDLPRPPKIPKLPDPVIKLTNTLKPIFKILCLLKKGFIPIPEANLATEAQTLTQPTVQVVLPIIQNLGIQLPAIQYNYVEQIRIEGKISFEISTDFIYLVTKAGSDILNALVEEGIKWANRALDFPLQKFIDDMIQQGVDAAKAEANKAIEEAVEEALDEVDEGTDGAVSENFENENEIVANYIFAHVEEFDRQIREYAAEVERDAGTVLETYYLSAKSHMIEPSDPVLNRSIAELEEHAEVPYELRNIAHLRDSLLAYAKGPGELDETRNLFERTGNGINYIASLTTPIGSSDDVSTIKTSFFSNETGRLLAFDSGFDMNISEINGATGNSHVPKGFFVATDEGNQNILNYTDELQKTVHILFDDADDDSDHDIIFSMGGDVYLKENYKNNPKYKKGKILSLTFDNSVSDYSPSIPRVADPTTTYNNHESFDLQWDAVEGASSYDVYLVKSLDDDINDAVFTYSTDKTRISPEIENGNYYAYIFAKDANGNESPVSEHEIVAPQSCADKEPPFPAVSDTSIDLALFKEFELDVGNSFDSSGEIVGYELEDMNGTIRKDKQNPANPNFRLGPYTKHADVGMHEFLLHVTDQSGNTSTQSIDVNVYVPDISLDESFAYSAEASGDLTPVLSDIPLMLMRERYIYRVIDGVLSLIPTLEQVSTASSDAEGMYFSEADGTYNIADFNLENMILVKNSNGEVVAEINPDTGNVKIVKSGYETSVQAAMPPGEGGYVEILDSGGNSLGKIYLVADANVDVEVHGGDELVEVEVVDGVHIFDIDPGDEFYFKKFSANDPAVPGGAGLFLGDKKRAFLIVDSAGKIIVPDKNIDLKQNKNDHKKDPLGIAVLYKGVAIGEIYIGFGGSGLYFVGPNDVPYATVRPLRSLAFGGGGGDGIWALMPAAGDFVDVDENIQNIAVDLFQKGIIEGVETDAGIMLNPRHFVERSEFVKTLLIMLCIIPREEAYKAFEAYEAGGGFADIFVGDEDLENVYAYIKEAALRGLIHGYKGNADEATGLHPFKPFATISRAEAVKVILEALQMQGVIDISRVKIGEPWYEPFMVIAGNLDPYVVKGSVKNGFIVTAAEALSPNEAMTYEDLILMADRVLDLYNCFEIECLKYEENADSDQDGVDDAIECSYGLDPNKKDSDGGGMNDGDEMNFGTNPFDKNDDPVDDDFDGLTNQVETNLYGTDPLDPDTDDGGVNDGDEVLKNGTDPLDGSDDYDKGAKSDGEAGLYLVPAECDTCPCISTFVPKSDVYPGDTFFTVIPTNNFDGYYFESKSNEVIITNVNYE